MIKLDAATKKALAGAELQIIKIQEDGSELIVEEWTSKEEAHVSQESLYLEKNMF